METQKKVYVRSGDEAAQAPYGYSHWSGKPVDDKHRPFMVPQSIMDGWQCFCSCGGWIGFASFYDILKRDDLLAALGAAHEEHAESAIRSKT